MTSYGTFKVTDQKCATCNFYQGARKFGMQAYKPFTFSPTPVKLPVWQTPVVKSPATTAAPPGRNG